MKDRVGGLDNAGAFPTEHRCYCGLRRIDHDAAEADTFWAQHRAEHRDADARLRRAERKEATA